MTVHELLAELRSRDIRLRVDDGRLRFDAPAGAVTAEIRETLGNFKTELVEYLRDNSALSVIPAPAIARADRTGTVPVSFAQRRMWLLHQIAPESAMYNMAGAIRLVGDLNRAALVEGLREVQRRHEVLRTTFPLRDGEPVQQIADASDLAVAFSDISDLPAGESERRVREMASEWVQRPFDLVQGPLFRAELVRLNPCEHVLLLAFHHMVCDGWSLGVFVGELAELYTASVQKRPPTLAPLQVQYADYAVWQRDWLSGPVLQRQLDYWRRQLAAPPTIELPTDRPRPAVQTFDGALFTFVVSPESTRRLEAFARQKGATLFMALLAVFDVLLYRWTGQSDVIVGSPIADRSTPELQPLIGFFVNTLPLRTKLSSAAGFGETLEQVRTTCLEAYGHRDVPVERLVEEVRPDRDAGHSPLYQVMFGLQSTSSSALTLPGVTVTPIDVETGTSRVDFTCSVRQSDAGLAGVIEYNTSLFDQPTIERVARMYTALVDILPHEPITPIIEIPLVSEDERRQLAIAGTGRTSSYPQNTTLGQLFTAAATKHGGAVAIDDGDRRWRYRELHHEANQLAQVLRAAGVGPNTAVGVWMERGATLVAAVVGIALAGGSYVPLEPTQPAARAAGMLDDAAVAVVVTNEKLASTVPAGPWRIVTLEDARSAPGDAVALLGSPDDCAYIIYTSGSTGRPKGVVVPQRGVIRLVSDCDYVKLGPQTVIAQAASAAFDAATFEIWGALLHGGRLVIVPTEVVLAPAALGTYLQRTGVTTLFLTTALIHQIGRERPDALGTIETVLFGGEAVEPRWVAAIQAAGGPKQMVHVYGPTETTTFATWFPVADVADDAPTIPIGGPIVDTSTYVLDQAGNVVPLGLEGELFIGGDGLAHGYAGAPRLTAERFVPDGVSGAVGARLYRTGDVVKSRVPGVLQFLGRRDNQVKLRGYRIELDEVEAALSRLAGVGAAVVVVCGTGTDRRLVGYVMAEPGAKLTSAVVRDAVKGQIPAYMVPAVVVVLDELPLTPNGKIDRRALPEPAPDAERTFVAPRGQIEITLTAIWRRVLDVEQVGITDNFFDLGGHSLLLVRVQAGLEEALSRHVPLVTLFQYPTIEALAAHLSGVAESNSGASPAHANDRDANDAIAIIGMAGRFPGAPDVETFWTNLRAGAEMIRTFTADELKAAGLPAALIEDPQYVPARGALTDIDQFDAQLFGFTPSEAALLDPQQRLLLECAWEALERAGVPPRSRSAGRVGVYAGTSANSYLAASGARALAGIGPVQLLIASDRDFLATRLSYELQLTGPSVTVQTACSTSLVAVHAACQALRSGECDVALAGGVSIVVPSARGYLYQPEGITSPDGHCRPFDARAAGTVGGDGVGVVVLKPLRTALADGDPICAVIRGTAVNNDGADKIGFTAPSVNGQAAVIAAALRAAGVEPETITFVEAHGTGTALGDPIEFAALRRVFGEGSGPNTCAIGALKAAVGHLDAAAGVAGLIKSVLALMHQELPPNPYFTAPNPQLDLGPFYLPTQALPWTPPPGLPRRAGVSSFGMGGTNAHVILEEAPPALRSDLGREWHIVPVSAQSANALGEAVDRLTAVLEREPEKPLADVAYTLQVGRPLLTARRFAVGRDRTAVIDALRSGSNTVMCTGKRPLVWMFPGQGTQLVETARALYETEPPFRSEVDACAESLSAIIDCDLRALLYPAAGDESSAAMRLADTEWTQVALVTIQLAMAALWREWGIVPDAVVGHSLGEITAACIAGVLSREEALELAAIRGRLMQEAPCGAMLAVAGSPEDVAPLLGPTLSVAAVNAPHQCVLSGTPEAIEAAQASLAAQGRATQRLSTSRAFHSALMAGVIEPLSAHAARLKRTAPRIPWISTVSGRVMTADEATSAEYWGRQAMASVSWTDAIAAARQIGSAAPIWLEVGQGHTLSNLLRSGASAEDTIVSSLDGPDACKSVAVAAGRLWAAGVQPDWRAYHAGARRRTVLLPTYPFQRQRYWLDARTPSAAPAKKSDPATWFYRPLWKQAPPLSQRSHTAEPRRWLLISDRFGLAEALASRLLAEGDSVIVEPAAERGLPEYEQLLRGLDDRPETPTDIVHLASMTSGAAADNGSLIDASERTFNDLLALGQALTQASFPSRVRLAVVTNHAYAVTGEEPVNVASATALGLCRTISTETPIVACRQIDLAWGGDHARKSSSMAAALAVELQRGAERGTVALRGLHRWIQDFEPLARHETSGGTERLRDRGVYLITGGLGGVGLTLAESLAAHAKARLVLVGRTALPERKDWAACVAADPADTMAVRIRGVQRLEALGADVMIAAADVSSFEQMSEVVKTATARFGPINGVIHAAGIAGAGVIALKDADAAAEVLAPKVRGTIVLDRLLNFGSLDFVVLCSSLTAYFGGPGQVDYCAANAFLDAYAQSRWCAGHTQVVSVNWDTWRGVGMAEKSIASGAYAERRQRALDAGITEAEGREVFLRALATGLPNVAVCTKDLHAFIDTLSAVDGASSSNAEPAMEQAITSVRHPRPSLPTAFVAPARDSESVVCDAFQRALGIDRIGINDNFFELGGHSLLAVDLMAHLNRRFGASVPVAGLYEGLTPALLAALFDDHAQRGPDTRSESAARQERRKRQAAAPRRRHSRSERRHQS